MELVTVKIIVLLISGLVRVFFGMIPFVVAKLLSRSWNKGTDKKMKKVISVLMFFGGGVLLATCFLHMMPEVRDNFRTAEPELELPLSEIVFLGGFFLVYVIEDIVHSIIHQRLNRKEAKLQDKQNTQENQTPSTNVECETRAKHTDRGELHKSDNDTIRHSATTTCNGNSSRMPNSQSLSSTTESTIEEGKSIFGRNNDKTEVVPGLAKSRSQNGIGGITNAAFVHEKFQYYDPDWILDIIGNGSTSESSLPRGRSSISSGLFPTEEEDKFGKQNNVHHNHHNTHYSNWHEGEDPKTEQRNSNNGHLHTHSPANHHHNDESHSHMPVNGDVDNSIGAEIRNVLIVIAISFHGVFEGMAIGLQTSEADVWYLFLAVSLHECTILFCIGVELISSNTKAFRMILYILVVSLVSPVGISIGIIITEHASYNGQVLHQALIIGCFQGLAAGTLLYVTFFEIFQEEGKKLHRKWFHILIAILGFVLMGSLEFMGAHNHGESHEHDHKDGNHSHTEGSDDHNHDDHHGHSHPHPH